MRLKWKLVSFYLEIVRILTQDRCTVCAKHTKGSQIIFDAPDGNLGDMSCLEPHFGPFRDGVSVGAR
jgi:hypothetical protein